MLRIANRLASTETVWQRKGDFMIELMTVGYEGLSRAEFIGLLERCRVTMLVDVRELPISRKPGFSKAALEASVVGRGLKYEHVIELGCPRDIRHDYREDCDWERYCKRFKEHLEDQTESLSKLAGWMEKERCCLLCYEEDFNLCHRSIVAAKVVTQVDGDVKINHLTGPMKGRVVVRRLVAA
jgi:uncharacterized protein (DUF488 family)